MDSKIIEAVKACQQGDEKAFETLYTEFSKSAYFLALKLMKNPQSAEDVTQEVFVKVFQKIGELKDPQAFPAWFKRIAVNQCTYTLKKNNALPIAETEEAANLEFVEETSENLIPDKSLENAETARLIVEIVDKLPAEQSVCIYYYYYQQMSVAEIAENLEVSENTVKTRLVLARKKIGKAVEKLEEKEGVKLYSIAPFVVPALRMAMNDTQVPVHLFGQISAELGLAASAANTAFWTAKTKILSAVLGTVVTGGIIAGILLGGNSGKDSEEVFNPISVITSTETVVTLAETSAETTETEESQTEITGESETTELSEEITGIIQSETQSETQSEVQTTQPPQTSSPRPTVAIGEMIRLGGYDWRVLDVQNGMALVLSDRVLATRQYHSNRNMDVTWENSDIRGWLNGAFYEGTFSAEEKQRIAQTQIANTNNQWHGTFGGNVTADKVFLLSMEELVRYFGDSGQLANRPGGANYINDQFNPARVALDNNGRAAWLWIRSPGSQSFRAACTNPDGDIDPRGNHVDNNNGGIRPALWLNLQ